MNRRIDPRASWASAAGLVAVVVTAAVLVADDSRGGGERPALVVSEVVASSSASLIDGEGSFPDWVEVHNRSTEPVELTGWVLSDSGDPGSGWEFPPGVLGPGERVVVFASGRGEPDAEGNLHADFRIDRAGEPLVLFGPDGAVDQVPVPGFEVPPNASWGRDPDEGSRWCVFAVSSPGAENVPECFDDAWLGAPELSVGSGFHDEAFEVEITSPVEGAEVLYTLDGSFPDPEANPATRVYDGPIRVEDRSDEPDVWTPIATTIDPSFVEWEPHRSPVPDGRVAKATVLRARSRYSADASATYFVGDHHRRDDLPVASLLGDPDFLFDDDGGLLVPGEVFEQHRASDGFDPGQGWTTPANYLERGRDWERPPPASPERAVGFHWCEPGTTCHDDMRVGVRVHGGSSRAAPRKSLRLYARDEYRTERFDHDLFAGDAPVGHRRLLLRNGGNDWASTLLADGYFQQLYRHTAVDTQAWRPVVVYLNGEYWGIHALRERYDEHHLALVHGADPDTVVVLSASEAHVESGDPADAASFADTLERLSELPPGDPAGMALLERTFDLDDFFGYVVVHAVAANGDWPVHNTRTWRTPVVEGAPAEAPLDGRWRWLVFDLDLFGGGGFRADPTHATFADELAPGASPREASGVPFLLEWVTGDDDTRFRFLNLMADHLNTSFEPTRAVAVLDEMEALLAPEMADHVHRWEAPESVEAWRDEVDRLRTFARARPTHVRADLVERFDLAGTVTLEVEHRPERGNVRVNSLEIDATTPGVEDPSRWRGTYFEGVPVDLTAEPHDGWRFSHWAGTDGAVDEDPILELPMTGPARVEAVFVPR